MVEGNARVFLHRDFKILLKDPTAHKGIICESNPYGDGFACSRIADILENTL